MPSPSSRAIRPDRRRSRLGVLLRRRPDDRRPPWKDAALNARNHERSIECGPTGPDRDALAAEYRRAHKLAGVPPGGILRPRR
jgi:hypothetical protein